MAEPWRWRQYWLVAKWEPSLTYTLWIGVGAIHHIDAFGWPEAPHGVVGGLAHPAWTTGRELVVVGVRGLGLSNFLTNVGRIRDAMLAALLQAG